jgi:hypothetical protein
MIRDVGFGFSRADGADDGMEDQVQVQRPL